MPRCDPMPAASARGARRRSRAVVARRTPYVAYSWPRAATLRDFSRVILLDQHAGETIGSVDGLAVALRRQVGRGTFIFLDSPSVAGAGPRIRSGLARYRNELPRVRAVAELELQHAEYAAQVHLAVRRDEGVRRVQPLAPGTDDELPNAVHGIGDTRGCLGREPLVIAHLRVDDQIGVRRVQVVPERLHRRVRGERAGRGRVEPRVVPDREHALLRGGGEIAPQPGLLRRAHGRRNERVV